MLGSLLASGDDTVLDRPNWICSLASENWVQARQSGSADYVFTESKSADFSLANPTQIRSVSSWFLLPVSKHGPNMGAFFRVVIPLPESQFNPALSPSAVLANKKYLLVGIEFEGLHSRTSRAF